ncbi:3-deoxy-7-phosphoheptulonate synthase [Faecalicoccus pleomorphus]|uniref:3-deoxy-7-phosphoheptulonate synthase n=1 Tax=Faecalicoccus pleomorphus TaxID=1323 RepID=UPI00232BB197|nr:3-deoxy-7-phosphoheptulonate synthase [Faecalicoccus pleomorphus]MDB7987805.1 3-deoxy-7-phosphoheptulonate synthase [Faecalicoccus pleomorphus]MDB7992150.1 3-deoxy-7-phosphoheptulonate synthase [Faecalicoccus pleomorphus]
MIIIFKQNAKENEVKRVLDKVEKLGLKTHISQGEETLIVGLVGDTTRVDPKRIEVEESVERIMKVSEPYKLANRAFHPEDSVIDVAGIPVGGKALTLIAGPCSVESKEQVLEVARRVKASGANLLRGGAFKPRTSPYSFQGMGSTALDLLVEAKEETGLPIVTELMSEKHIDEFNDKVDLVQIGARNMQNFDLLKEVGQRIKKPVLLKRGLSNTYEEWLMSAEYIMANGNPNVILCERGIRTFETYTRNTLDLQAIPVLKRLTHLPVIIDPSHAGGKWWLVEPMAKAAVVAGCDGLMIEVHNDPENALCDGPQSLKPDRYDNLLKDIRKLEAVR